MTKLVQRKRYATKVDIRPPSHKRTTPVVVVEGRPPPRTKDGSFDIVNAHRPSSVARRLHPLGRSLQSACRHFPCPAGGSRDRWACVFSSVYVGILWSRNGPSGTHRRLCWRSAGSMRTRDAGVHGASFCTIHNRAVRSFYRRVHRNDSTESPKGATFDARYAYRCTFRRRRRGGRGNARGVSAVRVDERGGVEATGAIRWSSSMLGATVL